MVKTAFPAWQWSPVSDVSKRASDGQAAAFAKLDVGDVAKIKMIFASVSRCEVIIMKKNLLNLFVLIGIISSMTTSMAFADSTQSAIIQKQQSQALYAEQIENLRQQTEYLRQQNEMLKQQNQALQQTQAYNQGYAAGQQQQQQPRAYYHSDFYTPALMLGGLTAGYFLGHYTGHYYPHYYHHYHHCW